MCVYISIKCETVEWEGQTDRQKHRRGSVFIRVKFQQLWENWSFIASVVILGRSVERHEKYRYGWGMSLTCLVRDGFGVFANGRKENGLLALDIEDGNQWRICVTKE